MNYEQVCYHNNAEQEKVTKNENLTNNLRTWYYTKEKEV